MNSIPDILTTPIGFIQLALGLSLYDWQQDAVYKLELAGWGKPIVQISVLAPNEGGKSSRIVAGSALYHVSVHEKGKVVITTKDQKQLNEQIIPAIEAQVHKFQGYKSVRSPYYRVTTPTGGVIIAYCTDDANRVEGMHGSPDAPLLVIVDEAKSVQEAIFAGLDRCNYQAIIYCSSGGLKQGTFFKSHTVNRAMFHCVRAGQKDCPHIPQAKIDRLIEKYGINHPLVRSSVFGEFMDQDDADQFVIPHASVMAALDSPPRHKSGLRIGFVDFAEGTAEHTFAVRDGNRTRIELAFREANKHAACSRLIRGFITAGLKEDQIWGDAADKESLDILVSLGWTIHRKNFGAPAMNSEVYVSWGAEAWTEGGINIAKGELIVPNDDEQLIAELTCRKKTITGRGKLGIEEKYDMAKRGVLSPSRADAWLGANNIYDVNQVTKSPFGLPYDWQEQVNRSEEREAVTAMGANWG